MLRASRSGEVRLTMWDEMDTKAAQAANARETGMATIRFFHEIYGNVHELPDRGAFPYERGLQDFFENHLRTLTGVEFLVSEYSTGQRHGRRIDTLGIDGTGRPVVVEYKRRQDENVINQGLDYLVWLEDHRAEFRELVREKLAGGRVPDIDFRMPRLLCIAAEFLPQDRIAAENSRRCIELLRYRRYGDAYVALEWVHGGEVVEPAPRPAVAPPHVASPGDSAPTPTPAVSPPRASGADPDFSKYPPWTKTSETTRVLFGKLKTLVESLGSVRTDVFESEMSFKCLEAAGRQTVIAYIMNLYSRSVGIRLLIAEKHVRHLAPEVVGFTQPYDKGRYRVFTIRDDEDILKAEPLLRAAYDSLSVRTGPR